MSDTPVAVVVVMQLMLGDIQPRAPDERVVELNAQLRGALIVALSKTARTLGYEARVTVHPKTDPDLILEAQV